MKETPNLEVPSQEKAPDAFTTRLLELGLATDVEVGLDIDVSAYEVTGEDEFVLEYMLDVFSRYLNTPLIVDHFVSHEEERIPAYNDSGIFDEFPSEQALNSKLRLNRVSGVVNVFDSLTRSREIKPELQSFVKELHDETLVGYLAMTDDQRLEIARRLTEKIKSIWNKAIEVGELAGSYIE